jgi:hypothetical protein
MQQSGRDNRVRTNIPCEHECALEHFKRAGSFTRSTVCLFVETGRAIDSVAATQNTGRKGRSFAGAHHLFSLIFVLDAFFRSSDNRFADRVAVGLFRGPDASL